MNTGIYTWFLWDFPFRFNLEVLSRSSAALAMALHFVREDGLDVFAGWFWPTSTHFYFPTELWKPDSKISLSFYM